jgi:hypothetical protein
MASLIGENVSVIGVPLSFHLFGSMPDHRENETYGREGIKEKIEEEESPKPKMRFLQRMSINQGYYIMSGLENIWCAMLKKTTKCHITN